MKWILLILTLATLVSCSGSKKSNDAGEELAGIELNDSEGMSDTEDLFADEESAFGGEGDLFAEEAPAEPAVEGAVDEPLLAEEGTEPVMEESAPVIDEMAMDEQPAATTEINAAGAIRTYTVQNNETMMMIAFKIYGDYTRWHDIANQNPGVNSNSLKAGMQLSYTAPASEFNWNPQGSPYLIKWGDTLGRISGNVYGTRNRWRDIWNNNKPLIKDPNKIFAGFTIYYVEGEREVASR